ASTLSTTASTARCLPSSRSLRAPPVLPPRAQPFLRTAISHLPDKLLRNLVRPALLSWQIPSSFLLLLPRETRRTRLMTTLHPPTRLPLPARRLGPNTPSTLAQAPTTRPQCLTTSRLRPLPTLVPSCRSLPLPSTQATLSFLQDRSTTSRASPSFAALPFSPPTVHLLIAPEFTAFRS
ncbi:hypothetical protein HDU84_003820, partial [Entophlyctis sp. JEL0112]